jgi:hypothetical protein
MNKQKILKITGVVGIVLGSVCLFLAGSTSSQVVGIVGGVFSVAALIAVIFGVPAVTTAETVVKDATKVVDVTTKIVNDIKKDG